MDTLLTSEANVLMEAALKYAENGWPVFPCNMEKKPLTPHGHKDATCDEGVIRDWWAKWPTAIIGCPAGEKIGLWVLDVDFPDGPGTLASLEAENGPLPATKEQRTGSGGRHLFFTYSAERPVRNDAGNKLGPNLDVRGEGGYVILPPSGHKTGGTYEWVSGDLPAAEAPGWLLDLVVKQPQVHQEADSKPRALHEQEGTTPYGQKALKEECRKVAGAAEGTRNDTLNQAAFALGQLVAGGEIDAREAEQELLTAAASCGLPNGEARKTVASGLRAGEREPRCAPETSKFERPCDATPGSPGSEFSLRENGVYRREVDRDGKEEEHWVCSPLHILAETRDEDGEGRGLLLEIIDSEGQPHRWAMPSSLRAGNGDTYRGVLLDKGLRLAPGLRGKQNLELYLSTAKPETYARCVSRTGWYGNVFVLPDEVVGEQKGEEVVLQGLPSENPFRQKGTLEGWQEHVGAKCVGNSRLTLAVSTAFAAPLVAPLGAESGGFNLFGQSSSGKTTALQDAGAVCGGGANGFLKQWRATDNGLEGVAAAHCDNLLCLDEMSQAGSKTASEVAYMLGNGQGKARAKKDGGSRKALTWNLLFLSSGEVTLADKIEEEGNRKAKAGQTVRVVDIPADAGAGYGLFENLHGCESAEAFARQLKEATKNYYGTALRAFLRLLVQDLEGNCVKMRERMRLFEAEFCPKDADGQVKRVCGRFSLVAAAGELATDMGILPWPNGEATLGAAKCFQDWITERGGTEAAEVTAGLAQVRRFFQEYGDSRFEDLDNVGSKVIGKRAGYRHEKGGLVVFLVFPEVFRKDVCSGFDYKLISQELKKAGILVAGSGQYTKNVRYHGNQGKMYVISGNILGAKYTEGPDIETFFGSAKE